MFEVTLTEPVMWAFHDQLDKEAAPVGEILSHLQRRGVRNAVQGGLGSGFGVGLGVGGALGGAREGKDAYDTARAQGAGRVGAALSALGGGIRGTVRGAAEGAVIGAGAGALAGAAAPTKTIAATKSLSKADNIAGSLSNFGQRQVHSLTGWMPGGATSSVERIGAGAADARRALGDAMKRGPNSAPGEVTRARSALGAAEKTQKMGLTSLPGLARSVNNNGLLPTARAGLQASWEASGPRGKALMLGLPAASMASALKKEDDGKGGPGRGERVGRVIGGTLGGSVAPLSLAGGLVLGGALEHAGGAVGRGVDRLRGKRPAVPQEPSRPPASEPGDTGQVATERVFGSGYSGGSGGLE